MELFCSRKVGNCRQLEAIIRDTGARLMENCKQNQHGFMEKEWCLIHLLEFFEATCTEVKRELVCIPYDLPEGI